MRGFFHTKHRMFPTISAVCMALSLALVSMSTPAHAGAGTSGGNILSLGVGARAIAMGEAYTAQADDVSSLYWNPAGLAILNQSQASFMYNQANQDMSYNNVSVAAPFENGGIGGSLSYLSFGNIAGYDQHGAATGNVNAYSAVGTIGGAFFAGPWSAGATIKPVEAKLDDVSATGVVSDLGIMYVHPREMWYGSTLRLAGTVRNVGTGLKFLDQRDPFPLEFRAGAALVQMFDRRLSASMDISKQRDVKPAFYSGLEYRLNPYIALRAGYVGTNQEGNGLRAGIGLKIKDLSFDYAYSAYGDLGMSHRYELSMRFGPILPRLTPEERAIFKRAKLALMNEDYSQAVLLFDSLITMEPKYGPFRKYTQMAMNHFERQEQARNFVKGGGLGEIMYKVDKDPETQEIADLLAQSEGEETAQTPGTASPDQNALAPFIPSKAEKTEKKDDSKDLNMQAPPKNVPADSPYIPSDLPDVK
jgi:hypothetical protein